MQKVVAVTYTRREGRYRIISARRARTNDDEKYPTLERKAANPAVIARMTNMS
jgi:hypothetical protein